MAIQLSKKQSDLEKRLKLLRSQVYSKSDLPKPTYQLTNTPIHSDVAYLYQDLFRIGLLATAAISIQIILYYLLQSHILKFNLF